MCKVITGIHVMILAIINQGNLRIKRQSLRNTKALELMISININIMSISTDERDQCLQP